MTEIVLPQHANALGTAFGGTVLSWIDVCGAITAQRHCGRIAVTVAFDSVEFSEPIRVGDVVMITGRVNAAFRSSIEVEVTVDREERASSKRVRSVDAFVTFVSLDDHGAPCPAPKLLCENEEDARRLQAAKERRAHRLRRKSQGKTEET